jgi:hypothetical protein
MSHSHIPTHAGATDLSDAAELHYHPPFAGIPNDSKNPPKVKKAISFVSDLFSFSISLVFLLGALTGSLALLTMVFPPIVPLTLLVAGLTAALVVVDLGLYSAGWALNTFPDFFDKHLTSLDKAMEKFKPKVATVKATEENHEVPSEVTADLNVASTPAPATVSDNTNNNAQPNTNLSSPTANVASTTDKTTQTGQSVRF